MMWNVFCLVAICFATLIVSLPIDLLSDDGSTTQVSYVPPDEGNPEAAPTDNDSIYHEVTGNEISDVQAAMTVANNEPQYINTDNTLEVAEYTGQS